MRKNKMLTSSGVFLNFLKAIIGSGVLALPYAVYRAGIIPSIILLVIIWVISVTTTIQVCQAAAMLSNALHPCLHGSFTAPTSQPRKRLRADARSLASTSHVDNEEDIVSYMQLSMATFGERIGRGCAWISLVPSQFVISASFMIFISHNGAVVTGWSPGVLSIMSTLLASVMCIPRTMDYLAYTSTLGNIAFVVSVTCIMWSAVNQGLHTSNLVWWGSWSGVFEAFGVLCLCFSAHPQALSIATSADSQARKHLPWLITAVLLVALVIFTSFGFIVLAAFGPKTEPVVFDNFPAQNLMMKLVRLLLSVMLQATLPLILFPIFHILETSQIDAHNLSSRLTTRLSITSLAGTFAWLFVDYFEPFVAIVGGLTAITAFILPPLFYLELKPTPTTASERYIAIFCVILGVLGSLVSIASGIRTITRSY